MELLTEYNDVFGKSYAEFGRVHRFSHSIDTGDHPAFCQQPYRIPHSQLDIVDEHIQGMLKKGIIKESTSPWSQPLVIVTKKEGLPRFCVDFRKLTLIARKQVFPIPGISC